MREVIKSYEIGYLVRSEEDSSALINQLKQFQAEILFESEARSIKLAYPIAHLPSAYFGFVHFRMNPTSIANLNDALKLDSEIIRFLIISPPFVKERSQKTETEPVGPRKTVRPVVQTGEDTTLSNDLLEEKLEEILNK